MKTSEKILLGVGIFLIAGTALYLFLENIHDEKIKAAEKEDDKRPASNFVTQEAIVTWTAEKLGEKSKLQAMKSGLISTTLSNEEIDNRIKQLG